MPLPSSPAAFVAGDWGTSSLRLWACAADGSVLAQQRSDEGMSRLTADAFEPALRRHLAAMPPLPDPAPVVLCGMVGARQGWREAPYVGIPAGLEGVCAGSMAVAAAGLDVRILPGLANRQPGAEDVIRGEETQLLGLLQQHPALSGVVCLPGTHSKWVELEAGRIARFHTAMTGELFALLRDHSVLRHSMAPPQDAASSDAFARGVQRSLARPDRLIASLFEVRAAGLLSGATDGADLLSGLLIGAEIAACAEGTGPVTLIAGGALGASYRRALALAGRTVDQVDAEAVTLAGLHAAAAFLWPGVIA